MIEADADRLCLLPYRPSVRFIAFAMSTTGVFAFEYTLD
jgi:hypothetical protein